MVNKFTIPGAPKTAGTKQLVIFMLPLIWLSCSSVAYVYTDTHVQFKIIGRIPIVEGKINGKRAFFIMDTGASVSVLNEAEASYFEFGCYPDSDQIVVGFAGEAKINAAYNCRVEFGPIVINGVTFKSRPMQDFAAVIQQHETINIAGIIGSDVFRKYNITIDYGANTVSFGYSRPQRSVASPHYEGGFAKLPGQLF